jgi:hypothetical protein
MSVLMCVERPSHWQAHARVSSCEVRSLGLQRL